MTGERPVAREVEGTSWSRVGRSYRAPLLIQRFPSEVAFGFLGRLLPPGHAVELTLEAHPIPAARALEVLHGVRAVAEAELADGGGGAELPQIEAERESAEELGRAVARRTQELWKVGVCFVARGPSRLRAEEERSRLSERLEAMGFRTRVPRYEVRETLAPPDLSGVNRRPSGYWQTLSTDGLAAMFPFVDEALLEAKGVLVGLALADASPVVLDRWAHASHSWALFGTTGAGKTFAAALIALRTRWMRPETDLVILDPLGEYVELTRALGGTVIPVTHPESGRLNPLDPTTTAGDRKEKAARVGTMLRALFPTLRDEESALLDTLVSRLLETKTTTPTFLDLVGEVAALPDPGRLATLLEVFKSGSLKPMNGPTTLPSLDPPVTLDLSRVPEDQLPFHLTYLLDWLYGRMRDRPGPKLVLVDEAHLLARHDATAEFLDRVVRHVRHFSAGLLLISQAPDDFLRRPSGRSLLRNLYATALLRLTEVSAETRTFYGLTPAEAEWLPKARLPKEAGYAESLWRIGEWHLPLALVATTPEFDLLESTLGAARRD
ncbi:MAG TPA: DUF87 domain-containing protein [Thermoplasmata archaeon]|nr:DUF87 domain-containing protein [Thermoplasmata archaeon]